MTAMTRGIRNVYRNRTRTLVVMLILSLSIGVFLTMVIVDDGIKEEITEVEASVGTTVEIRPAGTYGGFSMRPGSGNGGGGDSSSYLNQNIIANNITTIQNVNDTYRTLSYMNRETRSFYMGIDTDRPFEETIVDGVDLSFFDNDEHVAVVSETYADDNSLELGDEIDVNGTDVKIIGLFTSDTMFGGRTIHIPIEFAQDVLNVGNKVSTIEVKVNTRNNVEDVTDDLRDILDPEEYDVIEPEEDTESLDALESIQETSENNAFLSLVVGGTIVFFIMMLVTRERRREIGTLKAIGASNADILKQFMAEAMLIATAGVLIGLLVATIGGNVIASSVVETEENDNEYSLPPGADDRMKDRFKQMESDSEKESALADISYGFSMKSVGYAFMAAFLLGGLGMLYPATQATRMKPVEALRYE